LAIINRIGQKFWKEKKVKKLAELGKIGRINLIGWIDEKTKKIGKNLSELLEFAIGLIGKVKYNSKII
jgi:hypothetical protein